jgi:hypothetical protein
MQGYFAILERFLYQDSSGETDYSGYALKRVGECEKKGECMIKIIQTAGGYIIVYNPRYYIPNIDTSCCGTSKIRRLDVA